MIARRILLLNADLCVYLALVLNEDRKDGLLFRLRRDGRLVASTLSAEFGVSEDTIRRDLREMASEGLLRRVHGGALPVSRAPLLSASERELEPSTEQREMARAAAGLIEGGQVVLVDGGSTNLLIARQVSRDLQATILTTSPAVALALSAHERLEVVLLGGRKNRRTGTVAGPEALDAIRAVSADLCFLGVCGLVAEAGIPCAEREEVFVKRAIDLADGRGHRSGRRRQAGYGGSPPGGAAWPTDPARHHGGRADRSSGPLPPARHRGVPGAGAFNS